MSDATENAIREGAGCAIDEFISLGGRGREKLIGSVVAEVMERLPCTELSDKVLSTLTDDFKRRLKGQLLDLAESVRTSAAHRYPRHLPDRIADLLG